MKNVRLFLVFIIVIITIGLFIKWINFPLQILLQNDNLPIYKYYGNTITNDSSEYISNAEEFWLEPISLGKRIGKTENGGSIWEIQGQNPNGWVFYRGDMQQGVYRNINLKPLEYNAMPINEIQLVPTQGIDRSPVKRTIDKQVIQAIINKLSNPEYSSEKVTDYQNYLVLFLSPLAQGIAFAKSYVIIDKKTSFVYIASRESPQRLIPAGEFISRWVNQ